MGKKLGKKNVRVHIFCEDEGMKKTTKKKSKTKGARASSPPLLVPDLNGTFVDVSKVVRYDGSLQSVTFLRGSPDALEAFDEGRFDDLWSKRDDDAAAVRRARKQA